MSDFDFSKLGKEISESIDSALHSKGMQDLKETVKSTVQTAVNEVKVSVTETVKGSVYETPYDLPKKKILPVVRNPKGKVSGVLMTVFGSIFLFFFSLLEISFLTAKIGNTMVGQNAVIGMAMMGGFLVSAVGCLSLGISKLTRRNRYLSYLKTLGQNEFCRIQEFALKVEKKEKFVIRDLKNMMRKGWFLEGHFDEKKTCFIVTKEAYKQYTQMEESRKQMLEEERCELEREAAEQKKVEQATGKEGPQGKELAGIIEEGQAYIKQIRKANDDIPGEEISQKLERLERISSRIFEYIQEKPDKLPEIRKFLNYYLPTALKMVNAYCEFDRQPVQGENITAGKLEIEEGLDAVNVAFEKLFDQLFEEERLDIATDISVMSTMLSGDGLIKSEFEL